MTDDTSIAQGASTLTEVIAAYDAEGYTAQLSPKGEGLVRCHHCGETSDAARLDVRDSHRLEGASDPDDMALVIATKCPQCRTPATLTLHYGPGSSAEESDVLSRIEGNDV